MGTAEPDLEELFEQKKRVKNPFVPLGAFITAGVLTAGLISFKKGNSEMGQKLMRVRVVIQVLQLLLWLGLLTITGRVFTISPKGIKTAKQGFSMTFLLLVSS